MNLKSGIDLNNLDRSVSPTEDFFKFVNGTWLKDNPIPADETRWGSFSVLVKNSDTALKEILESLLTSEPKDDDEDKDKGDATTFNHSNLVLP